MVSVGHLERLYTAPPQETARALYGAMTNAQDVRAKGHVAMSTLAECLAHGVLARYGTLSGKPHGERVKEARNAADVALSIKDGLKCFLVEDEADQPLLKEIYDLACQLSLEADEFYRLGNSSVDPETILKFH